MYQTTLTTATDLIRGQKARIRVTHATIFTIIGHNPSGGSYIFGIRMPQGVHASIVGRALTLEQEARLFATKVRPHPIHDDVVVVEGHAPHEAYRPPTLRRRIDIAEAVGTVLGIVAHRIEQFDRSGGASSQHYIDTGWYLTEEQIPGCALSKDTEDPDADRDRVVLTQRQVEGLQALVEQYDADAVSLELCEAFAESVREILP